MEEKYIEVSDKKKKSYEVVKHDCSFHRNGWLLIGQELYAAHAGTLHLTYFYKVWHHYYMIRKFFLVLIWFPITFIFLIANLTVLSSTVRAGVQLSPLSTTPEGFADLQISASSQTTQVLGANVIAADSRALLLESFLRQHQSPLAPYAERIVQKADENEIDFRLIVAIAMCESNLGKRMPTRDSYNAWGVAVYTGEESGASFLDWPHAIDWVSDYIKERFYDKGIKDLKEIGAIYAPPSVENGYSWTNCVETFQQSIL